MIARVSDSGLLFSGNRLLLPLRFCRSRLALSTRWLGILFGTATEHHGYNKMAQAILSGRILQHIYLPVAILPALIAFPKNCKHKD